MYAHDAIYDDPWSYCDTRFKIAGQWYGGLFSSLCGLFISFTPCDSTDMNVGRQTLLTRFFCRDSENHGGVEDAGDGGGRGLADGDHLEAEAAV